MDSQIIPVTHHNPTTTPPCNSPFPSTSEITWACAQRAHHFYQWLESLPPELRLQPQSLRIASADASFRRYLRISTLDPRHPTLIIMDAPTEHENSRPFVHVAQIMQTAGIRVPEILNWNEPHGFMLISDLGSQTILEALNASIAPTTTEWEPDMVLAKNLLTQATQILIRLQLASKLGELPVFGESHVHRDLHLFPDWYIGQHRQITLTPEQQNTLHTTFNLIAQRVLACAPVYMHRDYMPRNIMLGTPQANGQTSELGLLDFQDATYGPITYDIASLMRDAFHSWDEEFVIDITIRYWEAARKAGLPVNDDFADFWIAVEWMALQRHLKILGIFARLTLRDGKPKYLADTPRFIQYVRATCARYRELTPLLRLIDHIENIQPQFTYQYGR